MTQYKSIKNYFFSRENEFDTKSNSIDKQAEVLRNCKELAASFIAN